MWQLGVTLCGSSARTCRQCRCRVLRWSSTAISSGPIGTSRRVSENTTGRCSRIGSAMKLTIRRAWNAKACWLIAPPRVSLSGGLSTAQFRYAKRDQLEEREAQEPWPSHSKWAWLGTGGISRRHLPAYQQFPDQVQLTAACDIVEDAVIEFGEAESGRCDLHGLREDAARGGHRCRGHLYRAQRARAVSYRRGRSGEARDHRKADGDLTRQNAGR